MDREKQRAIASKGGKAAHAKGTAHEFTPEEARAAGRKGGMAAHARGTAHEFTPEEARAAGRKGGQSARANRGGQQGQSHPEMAGQPHNGSPNPQSHQHPMGVAECPVPAGMHPAPAGSVTDSPPQLAGNMGNDQTP